MKQIYLLVTGLLVIFASCKKAAPEKETTDPNLLAVYTVVETNNDWTGKRTGDALGFDMKMFFYKDDSFKKVMMQQEEHVALSGRVTDTIINDYAYILLIYGDDNPQPNPARNVPAFENINNNRELLFQGEKEAQYISMVPWRADGMIYTYQKQ